MPLKVLVIDDEETLRTIVAQSFRDRGYTVLTADNGTEGLDLAKKEHPEIIILDLLMPGMLGFEVCKRIREDAALTHSVVLITSAKSYKPDIDKALELGADAFVVKPADTDELIALAQEHLARRSPST